MHTNAACFLNLFVVASNYRRLYGYPTNGEDNPLTLEG